MFGLTTALQNSMTQPSSPNNHGPAPLQGKGQGSGLGLPRGGGWTGVLPTSKVTADKPSEPWKFHSNLFTCLKVIHDFQCHGRTDAQTHNLLTKRITPLTYMGAGGIFFYPVFLPLTKWCVFGLIFNCHFYRSLLFCATGLLIGALLYFAFGTDFLFRKFKSDLFLW